MGNLLQTKLVVCVKSFGKLAITTHLGTDVPQLAKINDMNFHRGLCHKFWEVHFLKILSLCPLCLPCGKSSGLCGLFLQHHKINYMDH
ncbi:hypothetical protein NIES4071_23530 [Calothrix sp. NIES-4071]|nr:hypothetical protein NIES4071_23530 [Calothrix sp. NIES-4071]BAZ56678.1 hypothetical protein NIES4105_23480 [Calothrix sp. NIES-4105]